MDIRLYACFPHKVQFGFAQERYDRTVVFLLTAGQFTYAIDDRPPQRLSAGSWVVCPAGAVVHRRAESPMTLHMIQAAAPFAPDAFAQSVITPRMEDDLRRLAPFGFCAGSVPDEAAHWCADVLLEIRDALRTIQSDDRTVLRALLREMTQFPARAYPNDVLCRRLRCCESRLIAQFRAETGRTPQQYLLDRRLQHSRILLVQTTDPIGEIAAQCGFSDPLYFSRLFAKRCGRSPRRFRNENKGP